MVVFSAVAFTCQLMISTAQFYAPYDAEDCPLSWKKISLKRCIKIYPDPVRPEKAQGNCKSAGGALLTLVINQQIHQRTVSDVSSLLHHLHVTKSESKFRIASAVSITARWKTFEDVYNGGYREEAWLMSADNSSTSKVIENNDLLFTSNSARRYVILRRLLNRTYNVEHVSSLQAIYPFVCSLGTFTRRKLLYQQSLLPTGSPKMVVHPNSKYHYVKNGVDIYLSLSCVATGKPFPRIRWYKNGVEELSTSRNTFLLSGGSLLLPLQTETDANDLVQASYHCTAENSQGIVRSTVAVVRPAFIDTFPEKRLDVYSTNYPHSGARIECQAPAHHPRSYSYSWLLNDTTDRFVAQNDRIFISRDGTLYFSYNVKEDEISYACSIALLSTQSGIYGPFFNLRLAQHVTEEHFPPYIDSFQPQIFPDVPELGHSAYLECFAYARYQPSPTYRWSRMDGKPLSQRAVLTSNGRVLRIDYLEVDDEGAYRCTALNQLGSDSAVVNLNIFAKPKILTPLYDRMLPTNATAVLDCVLANGSTVVEWFRNASPLNMLLLSGQERARISIQKSRLTIASTRAEDSAVYQCIATNMLGSVSSSARLTITDFKPRFDSFVMRKKVSAVPGMRLVIPCIYESLPAGFAAWFRRGGKPIYDYGRVRQQGGIPVQKLVFENVEVGDEGEYICAVANRYGETQYSVQLTVIEKPNVIVQPKIKRFSTHAVNVSLICEVETLCQSADDCTEAQFDWYLNGQPLRSLALYKHIRANVTEKLEKRGKRFRSKMRQKYELELPPALGSYRFGRFACTSFYGGGASELESQLIPPSPINLRAANVTTDSVELSWKCFFVHEQRRSQPKIDAYKIEMRTKNDMSWRSAGVVTVTGDYSLMLYRIDRLRPNEEYQFRVKAYSGKEYGPPSRSTSWLRTAASAPLEPVNRIWFRKLNSRQILLWWDSSQLNQKSGPNLRYLLSWCYLSASDNKYTVAVQNESYVVKLNGRLGCEALRITVIPVNDIGAGPVGLESVAYVSKEKPTRFADLIDGRVINSTSVRFQWKWMSTSKCENFYGTKISCSDAANSAISQSLRGNSTQFLLNGLIPSATYRCQIAAFDHYGRYGPSKETVIHTKQAAPSIAPRISSHQIHQGQKDYSVSVQWTSIFDQKALRNGTDMLGYKIWLDESQTAGRPTVLWIPESDLQDKNSPNAEISGLKLMYRYTFKISGSNDGGDGPLSEPYTVRIRTQDVQKGTVFNLVKGAPTATVPQQYQYLAISIIIYCNFFGSTSFLSCI